MGCIFAELLNGKPILPGKNEVWFLKVLDRLFLSIAVMSLVIIIIPISCQIHNVMIMKRLGISLIYYPLNMIMERLGIYLLSIEYLQFI